MGWITQSLIALFSFAFMSFLITAQAKKGVPVVFTMAVFSIVWVLYFPLKTIMSLGIQDDWVKARVLVPLFLAGFLSILGNEMQFKAAAQAPNAGMAFAIIGCQAVVVVALTVFFLSSPITIKQCFGIVLALCGIVLLSV